MRVHNYIAGGLVLTSPVTYAAAASGLYQAVVGTPLFWIVLLAPLGLIFLLGFRVDRMGLGAAQLNFPSCGMFVLASRLIRVITQENLLIAWNGPCMRPVSSRPRVAGAVLRPNGPSGHGGWSCLHGFQ